MNWTVTSKIGCVHSNHTAFATLRCCSRSRNTSLASGPKHTLRSARMSIVTQPSGGPLRMRRRKYRAKMLVGSLSVWAFISATSSRSYKIIRTRRNPAGVQGHVEMSFEGRLTAAAESPVMLYSLLEKRAWMLKHKIQIAPSLS